MAITNSSDMSHIVRTTEQWVSSYDKSEIIPLGVLCVEITSSKATRIKIGDGHSTFSKLPYVGGGSQSSSDDTILQILRDNYVMSIKGNTSSLPSSASCGDVWFVRDNSSSSIKYTAYVYSPNHTWVQLGGSSSETDLTEITKYIDDKIEEVNQKIDEINEEENHIHDNKEILDLITAPFTAEEKSKLESLNIESSTQNHTHKNKDILDLIDDPFTSEDRRKLDKLNNYDDSLLKEKISALEKLSHEHSNKRVLDRTTASFTLDYEKKMRWIRQYVGSDGMNEGIMGLVPPAAVGEEDYVLSGSGEWIPIEGLESYELPIATDEMLGGVKIGDGIDISEDGTISVDLDFRCDLVWVTEGDAIEVVKKPIPGNKTIDILQECTTWSHQVYLRVTSSDYSDAEPGVLSTAQANIADGYMILPSDNTRFIVDVKAKNDKALKVRMSNMSDTSVFHFDIINTDYGHMNEVKYFNPGVIMSPSYTNESASFNGYHRYMLTLSWVEYEDIINTPLNPSDLEYFTITYLDEDYENPIGTENVVNVKYGEGLSLDEEGKIKVDFPIATTETLGEVIVGDGLLIDENGVLVVEHKSSFDIKEGTGIQITEEKELLEKYTEIPYIESTDNQYTIIDYIPNRNTRVVVKCSTTDRAHDKCLFGVRGSNASTGNFLAFLNNNYIASNNVMKDADTNIGFLYGSNAWANLFGDNPGYYTGTGYGEIAEYDMSVNGVYVNGELVQPVTEKGNPASQKMGIFTMTLNGDTNVDPRIFYGRIYSFKIYEDDELLCDLQPVFDNELNEAGFYDIINDKFYKSRSSESFNYDEHYVYNSITKTISVLPATKESLGGIVVGEGLSIDENGVLNVDKYIGTGNINGLIIRSFTYTGNGNPDNYIQFPEKPETVLNISGPGTNNHIASTSNVPLDKNILNVVYGGNRSGVVWCNMEYNLTDNILHLYGGDSDDGGRLNVADKQYTVYYTVPVMSNESTAVVVKRFEYVGTGGEANIQFPEKPLSVLSMYGNGIGGNHVISGPFELTDTIFFFQFGGHNSGVNTCDMSYNEETNILRIYNGGDDGARFNISGEKYTVQYLIETTINGGIANGESHYELPIASDETLGGIKVGNGLQIDENGVLSTVESPDVEFDAGDAIEIIESDEIVRLNPIMSDYNIPSGTVIQRGQYGNRYGWLAFDGIDNKSYQPSAWCGGKTYKLDGSPDTCYVGYMFTEQVSIIRFDISIYADQRYNGCIQVHVDDQWITVVDTVNIPGSPKYTKFTFNITETICDGFRFSMLSGYNSYMGSDTYGSNVVEFEAYGYRVDRNKINVKYNKGLTLNDDNELEVKLGDGLVFDENGVIMVDESIKHPPIKAGTGIEITQDEETNEDIINVKYSSGLNINDDNELFVDGKEDTIPRFTKAEYEQAVIDGTAPPPGSLFIITDDEGKITDYELPIASDEVLGGIKVGEGLSIDENGVLRVNDIHAYQVDMKDYQIGETYTPIEETDNVSTAIGKLDVGLISKEDKIPRFTKEEYEQAVLDGTAPKPGELFIITDDLNPLDPYGVIDVKTTENEVGKLDIIKNTETKTIDIFEYLESLTLNCVTDDSSI